MCAHVVEWIELIITTENIIPATFIRELFHIPVCSLNWNSTAVSASFLHDVFFRTTHHHHCCDWNHCFIGNATYTMRLKWFL